MKTNIIQAEWIGKQIKVVKAANKSLEGVQGTLVNETKNMITVRTSKGLKRIQKASATFRFGNYLVDGNRVLVAPHERIKLKVN